MNKLLFILSLILLINLNSYSQDKDATLFTINGESVPVSEFLYIYQKNLGDKADFSKNSLQEYLDLFINFKLKVQKAKELKLDTTASFKREMAGYREQLAKSYLVDKEVNERMIKEAYDRMQKDLKVSHILISFQPNQPEEKAEMLADSIYGLLNSGQSFQELAKKYSDDKYTSGNGGDLGWVTAMLPSGFYEFENEIYKLKKGEYSKPFKTQFGYHIVKLDNERPARGEIEASHILIRPTVNNVPVPNAKVKIDSIYNLLKKGENFVTLAREYSDDNKTAPKGGYLGFFGINKYDPIFEDKAFELEKDGDYTKPFLTSVGWHIIKRMSKPGIKSYDDLKRTLANEINQNDRYEIGRKALTEKIKKEAGYTENKDALKYFTGLLDNDFYTFKWNAPKYNDMFLFKLANQDYELRDFVNFLKNNQRERMGTNKSRTLTEAVNSLFDTYVENECIKFEEMGLENKYDDFRFLMKEYTEGNLLFEVMENEVWNKASKDSTGLQNFFDMNRENYLWQPRAEVVEYTINSNNKKLAEKIKKYAKSKTSDKVINKFNKKGNIVNFKSDKIEEKDLTDMKFEAGYMTDLESLDNGNSYMFKKVENTLPITQKSLDDAKGYVIADYQEYLESNWIKDLKKQYPVKVNEQVFESLVK
ncbi:MAG: peptidylprolyl isomerase [Saprospiraceae bacterium]